MTQHLSKLVTLDEAADLRAAATPAFEPAARPLAPGVSSLFGSDAPFGSPAFAARDAGDITPQACVAPPEAIPGWRASGSLWPGERFTLRIPRAWNGRLVAAVAPGQRSEFACDRLFGDPLLARGFAYVCGNKGNGDGAALLEAGAAFNVAGVRLPRFFLPDKRSVVFWQHGPGHLIERWLDEMLTITDIAQDVVASTCGRAPEATYAIGVSNGGYVVRRAIEESDRFAGALAWNAVMWSPHGNLLNSLAEAIGAIQAGDPGRLVELGFPPDIAAASGTGSLYQKNFAAYWYITLWLHAMHIDPETSIAYGNVRDPLPAESWLPRIAQWRQDRSPHIAERIARFSNTGDIRCKLIDLASEYDHLVPPKLNFEPYAKLVAAAGKSDSYRATLIPNAQHVDTWSEDPEYPSLRPGYPAVMRAWDELTAWVEGG